MITDSNNPKYIMTDSLKGLAGSECTKCGRITLLGPSWKRFSYHLFPDDVCPEVHSHKLMEEYCQKVVVNSTWRDNIHYNPFYLNVYGASPAFETPVIQETIIPDISEKGPIAICIRCDSTDTKDYDRATVEFSVPSGGISTNLCKTTICKCGKVSINENSVSKMTEMLKNLPEFDGCDEKYLSTVAHIILSLKN